MRIEKIKYNAQGAAKIFFEDGSSLAIADIDAYSMNLKKEMEIDETLLEEILIKSKQYQAMRRAAGSLAQQNFSKKGLVRRLREKGIDSENALRATEFFAEKGYIDDKRYAANLAVVLHNTKLYGRRRIAEELRAKGIERDMLSEAMEGLSDDEIINKRIEKKHSKVDFAEKKEVTKLYNALLRAGFETSLISKTLREFRADLSFEE